VKPISNETALRETPATKGKAQVDKYGETSDNAPAMGLLHEYLKTLGVPDSRLPKLAAKIDALVKAEVAERAAPEPAQETKPETAAFREALEAMTLKDRRAALDQHYSARKKNTWTKARGGDKATPEKFRAWLDSTFPDRREVGLVLSDLKHLDAPAYDKMINWTRPNSGVSKAVIDSFGLPTKITKYDPVRDANAPKSLAEVVSRVERGEDSFKNLHRAFARVQHHVP
jgi:hypothetical protein